MNTIKYMFQFIGRSKYRDTLENLKATNKLVSYFKENMYDGFTIDPTLFSREAKLSKFSLEQIKKYFRNVSTIMPKEFMEEIDKLNYMYNDEKILEQFTNVLDSDDKEARTKILELVEYL